jgi:hypothetical protein
LPTKAISGSGSQTHIESIVSPPGVASSSKRTPPSSNAWWSSNLSVGAGFDCAGTGAASGWLRANAFALRTASAKKTALRRTRKRWMRASSA